MACKQVIVLPPEIPMIFVKPAHIQTFIGDMVPAMREVIAAHPLSATLANLPRKPLLPGAARVPSHIKLIVLYQRPTNTAPLSTITL
jgi:hypothetical protein